MKSPLRCHPRESGNANPANINWIPTFVGMTKPEVLVFTQSRWPCQRLSEKQFFRGFNLLFSFQRRHFRQAASEPFALNEMGIQECPDQIQG